MGHPVLAFLETRIITRFLCSPSTPSPPPPPIFFHFVIDSLFNLVKKIGLAWERHNSFGGIGFVVLGLCTLFCCCFFLCRKKKCQLVPKPHEVEIKKEQSEREATTPMTKIWAV